MRKRPRLALPSCPAIRDLRAEGIRWRDELRHHGIRAPDEHAAMVDGSVISELARRLPVERPAVSTCVLSSPAAPSHNSRGLRSRSSTTTVVVHVAST